MFIRLSEETVPLLRQEKVEKGDEINELDLVFLPMYSSEKKTKFELLKSGIALASRVHSTQASREKIVALMLVLSNKVVDKDELNKLWEEFRNMTKLKVLEVAEEKGIEKGKLEDAKEMLNIGLSVEQIQRITKLPFEKIQKLAQGES